MPAAMAEQRRDRRGVARLGTHEEMHFIETRRTRPALARETKVRAEHRRREREGLRLDVRAAAQMQQQHALVLQAAQESREIFGHDFRVDAILQRQQRDDAADPRRREVGRHFDARSHRLREAARE